MNRQRVSDPQLWHDDHEEFEDLLRPSGLTYAEFVEKGYLKGPDRFRSYVEKALNPYRQGGVKTEHCGEIQTKALPEYSVPAREKTLSIDLDDR